MSKEGLGSVRSNDGTYLSIAGGFIWNRKADESDADYGKQSYTDSEGVEKWRQGARYSDLTGKVTGVAFRTHEKFGENINVSLAINGEKYIISISTNNRYSQSMMKALLLADLSELLYIKPYDFEGKDGKRAMGISFRQDGKKLALKYEADGMPVVEADFFKTATPKKVKRFFEDYSDWFVSEIEEKICPQFANQKEEEKAGLGAAKETVNKPADAVDDTETKVTPKEVPTVTPLKMKRHLKTYIAENYEGKELPTLKKAELTQWYELSLADEDLPFADEDSNDAQVLDNEIDKLIG